MIYKVNFSDEREEDMTCVAVSNGSNLPSVQDGSRSSGRQPAGSRPPETTSRVEGKKLNKRSAIGKAMAKAFDTLDPEKLLERAENKIKSVIKNETVRIALKVAAALLMFGVVIVTEGMALVGGFVLWLLAVGILTIKNLIVDAIDARKDSAVPTNIEMQEISGAEMQEMLHDDTQQLSDQA